MDQIRSARQPANLAVKMRTHYRYVILAIIFIGTVLNYLDRTNLSTAAPAIKSEFSLNPAQMGLLLSAFGWSYAAMQIPGGFIVDRFGTRKSYGIALIVWSLFTIFCGFARNFTSLFGLRLGLGLSEAPAFPTNNRLVSRWFPARERAFATSVYVSGEYVGQGFLLALLAWIVAVFNWEAVFIITGVIGLIFAVFWFVYIREPEDTKRVSEAELDYISDGEGVNRSKASQKKIRIRQVKVLFKSRQMWGIYIGQFAINAVLWFFLTWFPSYLVNAKGFTIIQMGVFASVPFIAAFVGVLVSGYFSDWLIRKGVSLSKARKTPIIVGLLLACSIIIANYTQSQTLVIVIMSVAFFAQGVSHISWTLVAETSPKEFVGVSGGVFNFAGNVASFVIPSVFGFILNATGSFNGGLIFISVVAVIGASSYMFLVGKVHRLEYQE